MKTLISLALLTLNLAAAVESPKTISVESGGVVDILNKNFQELDELVAHGKKSDEKSVDIVSVVNATYGNPEQDISAGGSAVTVDNSKYYYVTGYSFSRGSRLYRLQRKGCSKEQLAAFIDEQKKVYTRYVPVSGEIREIGVTVVPKEGRKVELFEITAMQIGMDDDLICKK